MKEVQRNAMEIFDGSWMPDVGCLIRMVSGLLRDSFRFSMDLTLSGI
jgi:membrane protein YqaA with SNARE-associated domain